MLSYFRPNVRWALHKMTMVKEKADKILVVDDEPAIGNLFQKFLGKRGYRVVATTNGKDAINKVVKETPDLVFLDIKMPGMDGIELMQELKKINKKLAVVILTGYGSLKTAREAMKLGAYDYITKPFDIKLIMLVTKEVLKGKR